ncbi:MAG TPA: lipoate--protein ligase family protein [Leptospiraceae bacterium]|nr:lipoate--protein ligase family protein [Leptospiraceae bacterium]
MNSFFFFDQITRYSPYFNLALEEAIAINLLDFGYSGALRFWTNHNTIVLGISDSVTKNIPSETVDSFKERFPSLQRTRKFQEDSLYITRRASGGGTVFHDEAFNLNYSLFASTKEKKELYPVKDSYVILLGLLTKALAIQGISADSAGKSDIAVESGGVLKKISGNAQFRKRDCIVQHGTLILDTKIIDRVLQNLSHPPEEPEYRKNRKHSDFLTSLPRDFSISQFKQDLLSIFKEFLGTTVISNEGEVTVRNRKFLRQVFRDAKRLMSEKYANIDFIFSKT